MSAFSSSSSHTDVRLVICLLVIALQSTFMLFNAKHKLDVQLAYKLFIQLSCFVSLVTAVLVDAQFGVLILMSLIGMPLFTVAFNWVYSYLFEEPFKKLQ